jgi:hypothetical protein
MAGQNHTRAYNTQVHGYYRKEKEKTMQAVENHFPHSLRRRSHFGTDYCKIPPPQKRRRQINWDQEGRRLGLKAAID